MSALKAAEQAFRDAMKREPFPMECVVTGDWPIEAAIKAYEAAKEPDNSRAEAINFLLRWASMYFARNPDGTHMENDEHRRQHAELYLEISDWLKANGYS